MRVSPLFLWEESRLTSIAEFNLSTKREELFLFCGQLTFASTGFLKRGKNSSQMHFIERIQGDKFGRVTFS